MGEQFSLKGDTVRLARELADASGKTVTATIRDALKREHALLEAERKVRSERIMALARETGPLWKDKRSSKEIMDDLYDDGGLPI